KAKAYYRSGVIVESTPVTINVVGKEPEVSNPGTSTGLLGGLVAFYEMDSNVSGALRDSHGQNHGKNSAIDHVSGFTEKGNKYDGKTTISSVPHSSSLNLDTEFTLMADIFREGDGKEDGAVIVGKTFSSSWPENQTYAMAITKDNKIRLRANIPNLRDWVSTQTVPAGKWVRVIATYKSGEGFSLYLDKVSPEKSQSFSGSIRDSEMELTVGSASLLRNAAYARRIEGVLDNVGIWNRQLSREEISTLITNKITYPDFAGKQETSKISIVSPAQNSQFDVLSAVQINLASEGTIDKIELFRGTTLIATLNAGIFNYTWIGAPIGQSSIKAKAYYRNGVIVESAPVTINVVGKLPSISAPVSGLLNGLVAFYEMDSNVSGTLRDSHGQNHGKNSAIDHVSGFTEKGNKYDGNSSISSVPHSSGLNLDTEFTLMADVFRVGDGKEDGAVIVGKTFSSSWPENQTYSLAITKDNKIRIRANIPNLKDWVSTQTVPLGKWVRVIATYKSGEGFSLYLDKVSPEKSPSFSGSIRDSDMELTVGSASLLRNAAYARRVEGVLDNVGIWNRQLSKDEISALISNKITYPDFVGNQSFRISMSTIVDEIPSSSVDEISSTKAEAGETLIFLAEDEENIVFDHWSMDGERVSDQAIYELNMPGKDVKLAKHVRTFVDPEISVALPNRNSEVEAFSDIHIDFEIKNNDAEIEKIELFNREEIVGEITRDFLGGFVWKDVPQGDHQLTAVATDTRGKTHFSDPVVLKSIKTDSVEISNVLLDYAIGPNPTSDYLNVIFANLDGVYDFEFRVVSMSGMVKKVFKTRPSGSKLTIDVSDLTNGVYVLHLVGEGNSLGSKRFIKK
ncbi:LamG-like jellyroll fold domain-containing protein, partial [Algoriphagus jejuensis]|uniref:LamG-like jellyroll fold domain-containing protein n=1 Tax=Algoriphagus jejuensis TaxID=419934 RepID=UPI0031DDD8F7